MKQSDLTIGGDRTDMNMYSLFDIFPENNKELILEFSSQISALVLSQQKDGVTVISTRIYKAVRQDLLLLTEDAKQRRSRTTGVICNVFTERIYAGDVLKVRVKVLQAIKNSIGKYLFRSLKGWAQTEAEFQKINLFFDRVMLELINNHTDNKASKQDKELIRKLKIVKNDLQLQLNLMYQFIKSSPVGLAGCDDEFNVKFWNPMAARMTGYEQSFIIGKNFDTILSGKSRAVFRRKIPPEEHIRVRRLKINIQTKTGGNFHSLISMNRIGSADKVPIRYVISFADLSIEEKLHTQVQKIDQLSALARLADAIMHDIRNPISALALNIDVLSQIMEESDMHSVQIEKVLQKINRQIGELGRNLNQYVGYSGITELQMEPFDLGEILEELFLDTKVRASAGNVKLQYKRPRTDLTVYGDWRQLVRVFRNLLDNALESVDRAGEINITARHRSGNIYITVADNGTGIPPENIHSIYQPYFTTKQNGTGLGLFIVREIVRGHHGKIYCTSKARYGTRFTVSLPTPEKYKKE